MKYHITSLNFIIDKKYILERLSPEEIFCKYFNIDEINFKIHYKNPLRNDIHASNSFYYSSSNILYFNDFAWKQFDCFSFVMHYYSVTFEEALFKIAIDFDLLGSNYKEQAQGTIKHLIEKKKTKAPYYYTIKEWDNTSLYYWRKYIDWITVKDLASLNIHCLYQYFIGDTLVIDNVNKICFVYIFDKYNFQIYAPYKIHSKFKFFSTESRTFGFKSINTNKSYILILKSYKCFALARFLGLNVAGILHENLINLPQKDLDVIEGFEHKFTLFDNDKTGKHLSWLYRKKYNTTPLLFGKGEPKDFSDNLEHYGERDLWDIIEYVREFYNISEI